MDAINPIHGGGHLSHSESGAGRGVSLSKKPNQEETQVSLVVPSGGSRVKNYWEALQEHVKKKVAYVEKTATDYAKNVGQKAVGFDRVIKKSGAGLVFGVLFLAPKALVGALAGATIGATKGALSVVEAGMQLNHLELVMVGQWMTLYFVAAIVLGAAIGIVGGGLVGAVGDLTTLGSLVGYACGGVYALCSPIAEEKKA